MSPRHDWVDARLVGGRLSLNRHVLTHALALVPDGSLHLIGDSRHTAGHLVSPRALADAPPEIRPPGAEPRPCTPTALRDIGLEPATVLAWLRQCIQLRIESVERTIAAVRPSSPSPVR